MRIVTYHIISYIISIVLIVVIYFHQKPSISWSQELALSELSCTGASITQRDLIWKSIWMMYDDIRSEWFSSKSSKSSISSTPVSLIIHSDCRIKKMLLQNLPSVASCDHPFSGLPCSHQLEHLVSLMNRILNILLKKTAWSNSFLPVISDDLISTSPFLGTFTNFLVG
jgi:hypothetical protein